MQKRFSRPLPLKEILNKALVKWDLAPTLRRYEVMARWPEIVGERIAKKSRPTKFLGEVLVVEADHPAWVQELNLLKSQILEKIKLTCGQSEIRNIRFMMK